MDECEPAAGLMYQEDSMGKGRSTAKHDSHADVTAAIKQLREIHRIGRQSLRKRPYRETGDQVDHDGEAAAHSLNPETLYKIRVFADPRRGYTRDELDKLCQLCQDQGRALGFTAVIQFLAVPRDQRLAFQQQAIAERWSVARIRLERLRLVGRRRSEGGKQPRIPPDLHALLAELESRSNYLVRLRDRLKDKTDSPRWSTLPQPIRDHFDAAAEAIEKLRAAIDEKLLAAASKTRRAAAGKKSKNRRPRSARS